MAVLTETLLKSVDAAARIDATPTGYSLFNCSRLNRIDGGTAILVHNTLRVKKRKAAIMNSFECSDWIIASDTFRIRLVVIYRPPYSAIHPVTTSAFISEFAEFLESVIMATEPLLIAGDFNIHVNAHSDNDAVKFLDFLQSMGLVQHVNFPTHVSGKTLVLLITCEIHSIWCHSPRPSCYLSDHCSVIFDLNISKPQFLRKEVSFRKTKAMDISSFVRDLSNSVLCQDPLRKMDTLVSSYNTTLSALLDHYAPVQKISSIRDELDNVVSQDFAIETCNMVPSFDSFVSLSEDDVRTLITSITIAVY
ncbi:uncharacterized protein LOC114544280 [Dendronephthya gigantea]|uniref:uncharacterized protein LOC114544280 n=1 Tax=Dendronephthya gigantea TaxID=151771 RepID=UPI00106D2617|nr:uncharacterized protein LOC114544280 [Dendronephthya gigantea]